MGAWLQSNHAPIPQSLLFEWRVGGSAALAVVTASGLWLAGDWGPRDAFRWAFAATAVLAYLLWDLRRNLVQNVRPSEANILPTLGAGTTLTLFRGLFTALLAGFLLLPRPEGALGWAPAFLYLGVAVADFFDGYAARVHDQTTKLGAALDISFDALGTFIAVSLLVRYGQLPLPFLLVGMLYYLFHGQMKLRHRLGRPVLPLPHNPYRRMYAGFLFAYLPVALAPLFEPPVTVVAGFLIAAPVVVGFLVDWLFVLGGISPDSRRWRNFEQFAVRFLYRALPVGLRLTTLLAGAIWLTKGLSEEQGWTALFAGLGWPAPMSMATLLAVMGIAGLGMTTAGWLGRLAALVLAALAFIDVLLRGVTPTIDLWLLSGSIGILLLGTGRAALWAPEDAILLTPAGAGNMPSGSGPAAA